MRRVEPIPIEWIDRIWQRMTVGYGRRWLQLWDGMDMPDIKKGWSLELAGCSAESIAYALEHLPPNPPSCAALRALCREAPASGPTLPQLESKPADPAGVAKVTAELAKLKQHIGDTGVRDRTLARLTEIVESGGVLTEAQREVARVMIETKPDDDAPVDEPIEFPPNLPPLPGDDTP